VTPSFGTLYTRAFVRPRRTLDALVAHDRALSYAGIATGITALTYTLVYFFLAHNGGRPTEFRPWLAISAEDYYHWNLFLHLPSILLAWVSAAGFTQLLARGLGGRGSFEHTLAVLGFGISIASWWTGLHDLVTTFLGYVGAIDQRAYEDAMNGPTPARTMLWVLMGGYVVAFLVMFTKGVGAVHRLSLPRCIAAGALGFVVYQTVFVIFNR
jgi:hypothetical protein